MCNVVTVKYKSKYAQGENEIHRGCWGNEDKQGCAWKAHFMFVREINFRLYDCLPYPIVK